MPTTFPTHLAFVAALGPLALACGGGASPGAPGPATDAASAASVDAASPGATDAGPLGPLGDGGAQADGGPPPAALDAGAWGTRADLLEPNSEMSVADVGGLVYVVGGYPSTRVSVATVQVYDPATNRWRLGPPLPVALNHTVSAGVNGKLYVIGGQPSAGGAGPFVATVYELDPERGTWAARAPMPTARGGGACAVIDGRVYVAGGRPPRGHDLAVYDPAADRWRTLPDMPTQRNHVGAAAIDGKLFVVGGRFEAGFESAMTDRVEVFDPVAEAWSTRAPMPLPRGGVNAAVAYGYLHVFGGEGNGGSPSGVFSDHDVYDPARDVWFRLARMPTPVHGVTGASFLGGLIHLAGGGTAQGGSSGTVVHQVYRPVASYR